MSHLVSVIVPIFNTELYLRRCVDSILTQTYTNLEIILVNDGSTDNSEMICKEYSKQDSRVRIVSKENGGLSSARNAGITASTGDFLCFIDSDDYISSEMIEVLYKQIIDYNCDISECSYYDVTLDNRTIKGRYGKGFEHGNGTFMMQKFVDDDIFNGVVTKMFRRSLFNNVLFPVGRIFEEIYITLYFCSNLTSYVRTDKPMYYYVHRENSILRSEITARKARELIYSLENLLSMASTLKMDPAFAGIVIKRMRERNVLTFITFALSENKIIRKVYSSVYAERLHFGIFECILSKRVTARNKILYTLCRLHLGPVIFRIKNIIK